MLKFNFKSNLISSTRLYKKRIKYVQDEFAASIQNDIAKWNESQNKNKNKNKDKTQAKEGFTVVKESSSVLDSTPAKAFVSKIKPATFLSPASPLRPIPSVPPGFGKYLPPKGAVDFVNDVAGKVGGTALTVATAVDAIKSLDKATNKIVSNTIKNEISRRKRDGGGGSGGSNKSNNNSLTGGFSYNMMCDKPTSKKIDLVTGVRSGLIVNPGEPSNTTDYSELYTMGGHLLKKDTVATSFRIYIETVVFPQVQSSVQFNLNYAYEMSLEDFNSWFYTLTKNLELYYCLDSIIAFNDNRDNTNQGCRFIRRKITSAMRLQLNLMRDVLGKQPIPPRVLEIVRYMYQHYKFSELPGAPIYRLVPGNLFNYSAQPGPDPYKYALSDLTITETLKELTALSAISNKIYQAMPEWHVANNCMPPSCNEAYYDAGFRTFWFNASTTLFHKVENKVIISRTGDNATSFRYWLYTNNFDGVFFAMSSFAKSNEDTTRPGMWTPVTDFSQVNQDANKTNALCFERNGDFEVMHSIRKDSGGQFQRALQFDCITTPYWEGDEFFNTQNLDGSMQVAQECTFETWKQAVYNVSAWMFG